MKELQLLKLVTRTSDITLAYDDNIPFGLLGQGNTVDEAKANFLRSYDEMIDLYNS